MMRDRGHMSLPAPTPGPHCKRFGPLLPLTFQTGFLDDEAPETEALREHIAGCAYCQAVLSIYAVQEQGLTRSFAARVATRSRCADEIIEHLQEEPLVSELPQNPTPEQLPKMLPTRDVAQARLEAARLAMRPPKRRVHPIVAWLVPVAALLLISLLAKVIFTMQRPAGPAAAPPLALAPGVQISVQAISMVRPDEGWALGTRAVYTTQIGVGTPKTLASVLLHDHGGNWTAISLPATLRLQDISMVSPTDGWAVGNQGLLMHFDGRSWSQVKSPTTGNLSSIRMLSATDGWVSGENASSHGPALILQYDGHSWQAQSTPTFSQVSYTSDLQVQHDSEVWADVELFSETTGQFATSDASAILHYDGHQWQVQESLPNVNLYSLSMASPQEGWVLGNITNTSTGSAPLFLWHYAHGTLTRLPVQQVTQQLSTIPAGSFIILSSVSMVSPTDGWAIGSWVLGNDRGFFALHYNGEHWLPVSLPEVAGPSGFILLGISYQPDGEEWIIGSVSKTITVQGQQPFVAWAPLILNYGGGTWAVALE